MNLEEPGISDSFVDYKYDYELCKGCNCHGEVAAVEIIGIEGF